jgi:hypothetical protein
LPKSKLTQGQSIIKKGPATATTSLSFSLLPHPRKKIRTYNHPSILTRFMGMNTILLVVLILLILGALPTWPYSANWGYAPSGGLGTILVILVILALLGKI